MSIAHSRQALGDATEPIVVAIDGGGTKTECLVADGAGRLTGYGQGGPVNLGFVDVAVAEQSIHDALCQATGKVRLHVAAVLLGATVSGEFVRPLLDYHLHLGMFRSIGEARSCLASITPKNFGAVVLAGTGSFEWARNEQGVEHRTDGWGAFVGDQGSAYDIVRRALVAAARAVDGRGPQTELVTGFCSHFAADSLRDVSRHIYRGGMTRHEIASLAPIVSAAAVTDPVAEAIFAEAGTLLSEGLVTCIQRVGLASEKFEVGACGGVFNAGESVITPIRKALEEVAPSASLIRPAWPPVVGVLAVALEAVGNRLDRRQFEQIGRQYLEMKAERGVPS